MVSDAQVAAFERGKTTEAEVVARLGQPTTVINHNGGQRRFCRSFVRWCSSRPLGKSRISNVVRSGSAYRRTTTVTN
jgi:hypothetical protein